MKLIKLAAAAMLAAAIAGCSGASTSKHGESIEAEATTSYDQRKALIQEIESINASCPIDLDGAVLASAAVDGNTVIYTYKISDYDVQALKADPAATRARVIDGLKDEGILKEFAEAGMNLTYEYAAPGGESFEITMSADELRKAL